MKLKKVPYWQQLEEPRWQKKRLEVFQRDNFKCCECDADDVQLQVHHRWYVSSRMAWEYPMCAFQTLCKSCHQFATETSNNYGDDPNINHKFTGPKWEKTVGVILEIERKHNSGLHGLWQLEKYEDQQGWKQDDALFILLQALDNGWITKAMMESWKEQQEAIENEPKKKGFFQ